jgi:hydroxymethylglutaryl-CoA lyase
VAPLICDVGPRDGLQNEPGTLAPAVRATLVNRLARAGLRRIEAVSFVRDDVVPQMSGAEEVLASLEPRDGVEVSGLVLNERGYERLAATPVGRVNCTLAATESFNRRNGNATLGEALARVKRIVERSALPVTVTISVAFGCPFEGRVDPGVVIDLCERLRGSELVLADTIGAAAPGQVGELVHRSRADGVHLHNTRNTGYANAYTALEAGATVLDASVGGLGGCPFSPRATGNVATEDLAYMLEADGVDTGLDLDELVRVSEWLEGVLGRTLPGQLYRAWPSPTMPSRTSSASSASE